MSNNNEALAESIPDSLVPRFKPFDQLAGKERAEALSNSEYEQCFIKEVLTKKFDGVRCEVCNMTEEEVRTLARCDPCGAFVCFQCRIGDQVVVPGNNRVFRCFGCRFHEEKKEEDIGCSEPKCHLCVQKGGVLLPSFAKPVNRLPYWKNNPEEFKKTIFAKQRWAHTICAL